MMYLGSGYRDPTSSSSSSLYSRAPKSGGLLQQECKTFSRGSLDAIICLVGSQLGSLAVEKKIVERRSSRCSSLGGSALGAELGVVPEDSVRLVSLFLTSLPPSSYWIRPPLINRGRSGTRRFGGLVYDIHASESRRALLRRGRISALSWSQRSLGHRPTALF
jgi:hypothetical protein